MSNRVKIAMRQAVEAGVIFSRTEMDGILCSERIPPQFLVSISEEGQVLWSRAESNLEPSTWTGAASASAPKAKAVTLTARDDANDDPMDDTSTGRPDAKSTDDDAATASMQVDQPPQGRAVFTLHPSTANLSWAPVPSARLSTSVAK